MVPRATLLPVLLSVLLAGCAIEAPEGEKAEPADAPTPTPIAAQEDEPAPPFEACPPSPPLAASGNAPLLPMFRGPKEIVAQAVAGALNLSLEGVAPAAVEPGGMRWNAARGHVTIWGDPIGMIQFSLGTPWPSADPAVAREEMLGLLRALGAPEDLAFAIEAQGARNLAEWSEENAHLVVGGARLKDRVLWVDRHFGTPPPSTFDGWAATGRIDALHDVRNATPLLSTEEAFVLAQRHADCARGEASTGGGPMGLAVRGESLAHVFSVHYKPRVPEGASGVKDVYVCAAQAWVYVDAVTGKILDVEQPMCI